MKDRVRLRRREDDSTLRVTDGEDRARRLERCEKEVRIG